MIRNPAIQAGRCELIAIDPSSTRTGYALFDRRGVVDAGFLRPDRTKDRADRRVRAMARDLVDLIEEWGPRVGVIEIPSGAPGRGSRRGGKTSLIVYGFAAGALYGVMLTALARVHPVLETIWTRGQPKARRVVSVATRYPQYLAAADRDRGRDVADAIGLGDWWRSYGQLETGDGKSQPR